ncbi:MAG: FMN-binding protein [Bacillota bacterium]
MRKFGIVLLTVFLAVTVIGCSGSREQVTTEKQDNEQEQDRIRNLKNGRYLVKFEVSNHGDFPLATMEVKNNKIAEFKYTEYLAKSGQTKFAADYKYQPTLKAIPELNKQFKSKQDLAEINYDVVSGATYTKKDFKKAVNKILAKAKKGATYQPKYKNGTYSVEASEASHGWLAKIRIVVKEETIVGVNYREVAVKDMVGEKVVFNDDEQPVKENEEYKTKEVEIEKGDVKSKDNYKHLETLKAIKSFEKQIINNNGVQNINYDVFFGEVDTEENIVDLAQKALKKSKL